MVQWLDREDCGAIGAPDISPMEVRMKSAHAGRGRSTVILASLLMAATLSACETQQAALAQREDRLAAAGFIVKPANTPERQAMLARLPADRFLMRAHGDDIHYVFADPTVCGCLYVGTQQAYGRYRANELAQHLADEEQLTAQTYSDAAWSWDAWGPLYPGWGYRYGFGW
jgi:hypothetical protein